MAFYLKPPKGVLSFAKLEDGAKIRLQFLLDIHACNGDMVQMKDLVEQDCTVEDSEWLIEGGKKDKVSHYFCRLACSQMPEMVQFFIRTETLLFRYRITCMREEELQHTVKHIDRLDKMLKQEEDALIHQQLHHIHQTIAALKIHRSMEDIVKDYFLGIDSRLTLPFLSVIQMVKHRKVPLRKGFALVPVTSLLEILVPIFESLLHYGMVLAQQKTETVKEDIRIRRLFYQLKAMFFSKYPPLASISSKYRLHCDDIDRASSAFPLCMSTLHQTLRKRHRLAHSARIEYTLFLKECGLPVNEAILFWQREYSQPSVNSSCKHHWRNDGKRYIYSIRHLYGLEGARKNYRGHSCVHIQEDSPSQEGGCPFKHMDKESLSVHLDKADLSGTKQSVILEAASGGDCQLACRLYLCGKAGQDMDIKDIEDTVSKSSAFCDRKNLMVNFYEKSATPVKSINNIKEESGAVEDKRYRSSCDTVKVNLHATHVKNIRKESGDVEDGKTRSSIVCDRVKREQTVGRMSYASCVTNMKTEPEDAKDWKNRLDFSSYIKESHKVKMERIKVEKKELETLDRKEEKSKVETNAISKVFIKDKLAKKETEGWETRTEQSTRGAKRNLLLEEHSKKRIKRSKQEVTTPWNFAIRSPVDFYTSYCKLLDGLK